MFVSSPLGATIGLASAWDSILIDSGYSFDKVTLVDQFVYSKHQELIALFTYNN